MNNNVVLGYVSRFLSLGSGLIVLPLILNGLSKTEFVFWMFFVTFSSLVNVIDFGFMSTFSRYFNYIFAGAKELPDSNSLSQLHSSDEISFSLGKTLYKTAKKIYLVLSIIFLIFCFIFYISYLRIIEAENGVNYFFEWLVYSIGLIVSVYFLYINAFLSGLDRLDVSYKSTIISTLIFFLLAIFSNLYSLGMIGLCWAKTLSIFVYRFSCFFLVRRDKMYQMVMNSCCKENVNLSSLYKNSIKVGTSTIGAFLTNRASVFIVGFYLPIDMTNKFTLCSYLFSTVVSVSLISMNTLSPKLSRSIISRDYNTHKISFKYSFLLSNIIFVLASIVLVICGKDIISLLGSQSSLPDRYVILLFAITYFFEMNQQLSTTYLTLNNNLKFVKYILLFGFMYVFVTLVALNNIKLLVVAILSQLLVQVLFNNWYWPYVCFKTYKRNINDFCGN